MVTCTLKTRKRQEVVDITLQIQEHVSKMPPETRAVLVFVPHTTAALAINENADPSVRADFLQKMSRSFPEQDGYAHAEGNSDAHIKAILTGSSVLLILEEGRLQLGTWQGVYFCEFDGPRNRNFWIQPL